LSSLGAAQVGDNDVAGAICSLQGAVAAARATGSKSSELSAHKHLGVLTRDKEGAGRHYRRALALARELNDAPMEAEALLGLAQCAHALRRWDEARRLLQECFELRVRLDDTIGVAWCLLEIGVLQVHVGAFDQAGSNLKQAFERFSAAGASDGLAVTHEAVGKLAASRGDERTAKRELALAAEMKRRLDGRDFVVTHKVSPRRSWHPER
jgi:tetratricopeptide (TPR) repeat protein